MSYLENIRVNICVKYLLAIPHSVYLYAIYHSIEKEFQRCVGKRAETVCSKYDAKTCGRLDKPPYVCNGCSSIVSCPYYRLVYVS